MHVGYRTWLNDFCKPFVTGEKNWLVALSVFAFAVAVSGNTLLNGFVWDDVNAIQEHSSYLTGGAVFSSFFTGLWEGHAASNYYRPLIGLFYSLNHYFFGLVPSGYHALNVVLHGANSALVFLVAAELFKAGKHGDVSLLSALLVGSLFASHPVHTESVAWIAGITDVSCSFFFLLSLYLYIQAASSERIGMVAILIAASALASLFAALCKEPGVILFPVLVLLDFALNRKRPWQEYAVRYLPYLVSVTLYLSLRFHTLSGFATGGTSHGDLSPFSYFVNLLPLFMDYLVKLVLPVRLSAHYVLHPVSSPLEMRWVIAFLVTALFLFSGGWALKKDRKLFFCLAFLTVTLGPALLFRATGNTPFAERYLYLPSVGFLLLVGLSFERLKTVKPGASKGMVSALVVLICLYTAGSAARNAVWKDNYTLWSDAVRKTPDSGIAHNNLGLALGKMKQTDEAISCLQKAVGLDPNDVDAYSNLGAAYEQKGRITEAIQQYQTAISLNPHFAKAHFNLGAAYDKQGMTDRAVEEYREAIRYSPDLAEPHNNLGVVLEKKGRIGEAVSEFMAALAVKPGFAEAHVNLGNVYDSQGLTEKAIEEIKAAVLLNPDLAENRYRLGLMYDKAGRIEMAVEQYQAAISLDPAAADARNNLGIDLCMKGSVEVAIQQFEAAIKLNRDDPEYHYNLAKALEMKGLAEDALGERRLAVSLETRRRGN